MKAVTITSFGEPDVLKLKNHDIPKPGSNEILIKVYAAGINRPDIIQRQGKYPAPSGVPQDIPGLEVSGIVEDCGIEVTKFKKGDKVCALLGGGGYAEYCIAPEQQCLRIPNNLSFEEAASLPETFFTIWNNIFYLGEFKSAQNILIHGGSSGIGVAGVQMVKAMGGNAYATAGTSQKCIAVEKLGAIRCINYKEEDFENELRDIGMDIILDMVGSDYTIRNLNILNTEGSLIIINAMKGRIAEIDLMKIMIKRLKITGSTLRNRSPQFKGKIAEKLEKNIWPHIENNQIKAIIHKIFPLNQAREAHKLIESSNHIGKIILRVKS